MMRRRVYEQYGFYDERIPFEDYDLWLRLSRTEKFVYLPSKLMYYRKADTSLTNYCSKNGRDKIKFMIMGGKKVVQKNLKGLDKEKKQFYQQIFFEKYIVAALEAGLWDVAIQILIFMWRKGYHIQAEMYEKVVITAKRSLFNRIK